MLERKRIKLEGEAGSPIDVGAGCRFAKRCPRKVGAICDREPPPARTGRDGHTIHCHIPLEVLAKVEPMFQPHGKDVEAPRAGT